MKYIFKPLTLLVLIFATTISCQKDDLKPGTSPEESANLNTKGKPTSGSPYTFSPDTTQPQVYGIWHAGNDYCTWGTVRDMTDFNLKNGWIVNRGDGKPSVNLVVLSFVNPLKLLNKSTDATTLNGIPRGMTPAIVEYFKSKGIRVMLSIGGITYTNDWNTALKLNASQLAKNAAAVASDLGVGIEIDYEENRNPNLDSLQSFITTYRKVHPYDANGINHAARLTIDLAAGDRWLIGICQKATTDWLKTTGTPVLDYANAMVPANQPSASGAITNWDEHIDGKPQYAPPIPPLAPCKFTGSLYMTGNTIVPECNNFLSSIQYMTREYVRRVKPYGAGVTPGMLGYMFWAAECNSTRQLCTTDCKQGIGEGSKFFEIQYPMPNLRQQ